MAKNSELTIEKGVPIPTHGGAGITAIFRKLEPGDSVLVPINYAPDLAARNVFGKGNFAIRKVEGGHRIWRIK